MQEGFIVDWGDTNTRRVSQWVAGAPEPSFWLGVKIGDRAVYDVRTYRCEKCGFLESYAPKR